MFVGCVLPTSVQAQAVTQSLIQVPELHVRSVITAGENLWQLSAASVAHEQQLVLEQGISKSVIADKLELLAGDRLRAKSTDSGLEGCSTSVTHPWLNGNPVPVCAYDTDNDGFFDKIAVFGGYKWKIPASKYTKAVASSGPYGEFLKALVFEGLASGTMRFSYREFNEGFARPAFTQDLIFDIGKTFPQDITMRKIHIRIFSVDGNGISYEILDAPLN